MTYFGAASPLSSPGSTSSSERRAESRGTLERDPYTAEHPLLAATGRARTGSDSVPGGWPFGFVSDSDTHSSECDAPFPGKTPEKEANRLRRGFSWTVAYQAEGDLRRPISHFPGKTTVELAKRPSISCQKRTHADSPEGRTRREDASERRLGLRERPRASYDRQPAQPCPNRKENVVKTQTAIRAGLPPYADPNG